MKRFIPILISAACLGLLYSCNKSESKTTHQVVIPKYYHHVFNPPLELGKNDSLRLDLDDDKINDILLYVKVWNYVYSPSTDTIIKFGVYAQTLADSFRFSYGSRIVSTNYELLEYGQRLDNKLGWYSPLTLDGEIRNAGFLGNLEYMGIMKNTSDSTQFGWTKTATTDSSLTLYECYFSNRSSHIVKAGIAD